MATVISDVLKQATTANVEKNDLAGQLKKQFAAALDKQTEQQAAKLQEEIKQKKDGDPFNKTVETNAQAIQDKIKESWSPYVKQRVSGIVGDLLKRSPDGQKTVNNLVDSYVDNAVDQICQNVEGKAKSLEEYRIYAEAVIRAFHNTLNNDPELMKQIQDTVQTAATDAAVAKANELMQPLSLQAGEYITDIGKLSSSIVEQISHQLTTYNVDEILKNAANVSIDNISKSIADNTFGQLTDIPVIGTYFKSLQSMTEKSIAAAGTSWYQQEITKLSTYTKSIKDFQDRIEKNRQIAEAAITKAQDTARKYTEELENRAINEIKKYVNLDNFSIGGFKL